VIIDNFDVCGVPIPIKANSPLIVNSDAVLPLAVAGEFLQLITWEVQVAQFLGSMELPELPERGVGNILEPSVLSTMMQLPGILAGERPYHA
jgi:hypothetical protein